VLAPVVVAVTVSRTRERARARARGVWAALGLALGCALAPRLARSVSAASVSSAEPRTIRMARVLSAPVRPRPSVRLRTAEPEARSTWSQRPRIPPRCRPATCATMASRSTATRYASSRSWSRSTTSGSAPNAGERGWTAGPLLDRGRDQPGPARKILAAGLRRLGQSRQLATGTGQLGLLGPNAPTCRLPVPRFQSRVFLVWATAFHSELGGNAHPPGSRPPPLRDLPHPRTPREPHALRGGAHLFSYGTSRALLERGRSESLTLRDLASWVQLWQQALNEPALSAPVRPPSARPGRRRRRRRRRPAGTG
jgi:hypothetical protein